MFSNNKPLPASFYNRPVLEVAQDLIGCILSHNGTSGIIVETEAYHESEPACHAYVGVTPRTKTLFGPPGRAYVYQSYGIHSLFNAVTEEEGIGAAVLIRALEPITGIAAMCTRRATTKTNELCSGPGKLTQALDIGLGLNETDLANGPIRIHSKSTDSHRNPQIAAARIGITKATELPWRFCAEGSTHISRPWPKFGSASL